MAPEHNMDFVCFDKVPPQIQLLVSAQLSTILFKYEFLQGPNMLVQITAQLAVSSPETCCILRKQVSILTIATSMLPLLLSPAQDSSSTTQRRMSKIFRPGGMSWFLVQAVVHGPVHTVYMCATPDAKHLIKTPTHRVSKRDLFDLTAPSRPPGLRGLRGL